MSCRHTFLLLLYDIEEVIKMKRKTAKILAYALLLMIFMSLLSPIMVFASNLDSIDDANTKASESSKNSTTREKEGNIGSLFGGVVTDEGNEEASRIMQPFMKVFSIVVAVALSIIFCAMMCVTLIDIAGISIPPIRKLLMGDEQLMSGQQAQPQMGGMPGGGMMGGGMMGGMGGYGNHMGGMGMGGQMGGMGGMQQPQQQGAIGAFFVRFMSDEAMAALREANVQQQQMAMGGMMGGMGQPQTQQKAKSAMRIYLFKRMWFLILFGVTTVVLTSTILIAAGTEIGYKMLDIVSSIFGF